MALSGGIHVNTCQGTTGTPKGVDVSHQNVTNLVCLHPGNLGIEKETPVAQLLSVSFDMGKLMTCLVSAFLRFCTPPLALGNENAAIYLGDMTG
jgi:hypothetical protein